MDRHSNNWIQQFFNANLIDIILKIVLKQNLSIRPILIDQDGCTKLMYKYKHLMYTEIVQHTLGTKRLRVMLSKAKSPKSSDDKDRMKFSSRICRASNVVY